MIEAFNELSKLDQAIDKTLTAMLGTDAHTDEYAKMADQLVKLTKTKEIIGNLQQKAFEANNKHDAETAMLELKEKEIEIREQEFELRKTEIDTTLQIKKDEILYRAKEVDATLQLKAVETAAKQAEIEDRHRVSSDTLAIIAANVAGIALILSYERMNIITSKALSLVTRLR
jgi:hypothetical protein